MEYRPPAGRGGAAARLCRADKKGTDTAPMISSPLIFSQSPLIPSPWDKPLFPLRAQRSTVR